VTTLQRADKPLINGRITEREETSEVEVDIRLITSKEAPAKRLQQRG
jgi:hypothetical protein